MNDRIYALGGWGNVDGNDWVNTTYVEVRAGQCHVGHANSLL